MKIRILGFNLFITYWEGIWTHKELVFPLFRKPFIVSIYDIPYEKQKVGSVE